MWVLLSFTLATRAHLCIPLLPTTGMYLFFLAGPGLLHEIAVSVFSHTSPLGCANTFSFQPLLSTSLTSLIELSLPSYSVFLNAVSLLAPFLSLLSCISQTYPWTAVSLLVSSHTLSITLSHHLPACPFVAFSQTALSAMAGNLSFGMLLGWYCRFNFLTALFVWSGCDPSSAFNSTVLLVVREHPSIFSAAVICAVSSCFADFAFPSHTSLARSLWYDHVSQGIFQS